MRRRDFIAGALPAAAAASDERAIIDTHTHFYDPSRPQGVPWPPANDALLYRTVMPAEFVRLTRRLGVAGTIVVEASAWLEDNQWVLDLARHERVIRGFVGHLAPGKPEFARQLERFAKNPLFLGIRVGPADLGAFADLKRLADAGLALDVLGPAATIESVARLGEKVPGLRIVINHLPFDTLTPSLAELSANPNVYAKVSGTTTFRDGLDELWDRFGADRLVYASNWPVSERAGKYEDRLKLVRGYFDRRGAAEGFLRENSRRLYRWAGR